MSILQLFCVLFSISSSVNSSYMLIFYGEVGSSMNCTKNSTVSWENCETNCLNDTNCFLAYTSPTVSCYTCGYGGFKGITYSSEVTDYTFALKSWSANCSYNQDMLSTQNIDVLKTCPGGYGTVTRENYTLCAQRLYQFVYKNKTFATNLCTERTYGYGGQLLGLDSDTDRIDISTTSNTALLYNCSIWIGLELKNSVWTWTDPWMTGSGSIEWASGHPITGNTCASLQYGTGLLQSDNCSAASCTSKYCPGSCECAFLMQ